MNNKGRVCLNLEAKRNVILESDKGISARKLAEVFKCGRTQINNIIKNKDQILKEWEASMNRGIKRKRTSKCGQVNEIVYEWFKRARSKNLPVSGSILREKALQIAMENNIVNFVASNGWLECFRKRHNISFKTILCESAHVAVSEVDEWKEMLPNILIEYALSDIYKVVETGLYFRAVPNKLLTLKDEACKGGKPVKDRLTIMLCCNAAGEKEQPLVIGKAFKPRCYKNLENTLLGINWHANKKAWMTSSIFENWLQEFNKKMQNQNRCIILLLDNATCHPVSSLSNVKLLFIPPNATSHLQPLDQGIIHIFKLFYRKRMLRSIVSHMDDSNSALDLMKKITVLDAVSWIKTAWNKVGAAIIKKYFSKFGVQINETEQQAQPTCEISQELQTLAAVAGLLYDENMEMESLQCCEDLEGNWEARLEEDYKEMADDDEQSEEEEEINDPPMSLKDALQSLRRIKDICVNLDKECGENATEQCNNLYCLVENYAIQKKITSAKQTTLKNYFSKV